MVILSMNMFAQSLTVKIGSIPETAAGQYIGTAWVEVNGGTAPSKFKWNTGDTTAYIQNLGLGKYVVTVTDANNNTSSDSVEFKTSTKISIPLIVSINGTQPLFGHCENNQYLYIYNGIAPYNYKIFNATSGLLIEEFSSIVKNEIDNYCAGKYYCVSSDANNGISFNEFIITNNHLVISPNNIDYKNSAQYPFTVRVLGTPPMHLSITLPSNNIIANYTISSLDTIIQFNPNNNTGNYIISYSDTTGSVQTGNICLYDENILNPIILDATDKCNGQILSPNNYNMLVEYFLQI